MLNRLILWSLHHRAIIIGACVLILVMGARTVRELPVEVLPDLTKPTVTILTDAPGLAPEEVEALITQPIWIVSRPSSVRMSCSTTAMQKRSMYEMVAARQRG